MRAVWLYRSVAAPVLLFGAACALIQSPAERTSALASAAGFQPFTLPGEPLQAYVRTPFTATTDQRLTLYLEGDGAPWPSAEQPPRDPTPIVPLVIRMASVDPSPLVAYIGRPCQHMRTDDLRNCDPALWTHGRFSEKAVQMVDRMVDSLKQASGAREIALVGYSGGGAMAALLAARRKDTSCLVTIAAPLDTQRWAATVGVSSLRTSHNPATQTQALANIRQTHFSGLRDTVVPRESLATYMAQVPNSRIVELKDFDHECCWAQQWIHLRQQSCL